MDPSARDSPLLAQPFPAFNLTTLEDPSRVVDESLFKDKVTLVNVWGEWCPTCKHEMPQLLDLAARGVRLVGINYKDTQAKGLEFLDEFGNPFEVLRHFTWIWPDRIGGPPGSQSGRSWR